jgi:hypothetical protein
MRSKRADLLRERQRLLKEQICENLDLLIGSVVRSPSMMSHALTTKVAGKTVNRYVRNGLVTKVKIMTERNQKLRALIRQLSNVNWELLKLDSES